MAVLTSGLSTAAVPPIAARNVHFAFDASLPTDWHSGEPAITHFFNALSLTFPEGERFFIDSVRNFADRVADPDLKKAVEGFTAQESIHSREHLAYNAQLLRQGIPVEKFNRLIRNALAFARRHLSAETQLAITCADEHFTALFAEALLGDPRMLAGAHPFYADLWRWHALEEQEHKAVAFDVYRAVAPGVGGYLRRAAVIVLGTLDFSILVPVLTAWLMAHTGQLWNLRAWGRCFWYLWVKPGLWRRVLGGVGAYLMPRFHPWKRKSNPEVLAWRARYRGAAEYKPGQDPPLFDTA